MQTAELSVVFVGSDKMRRLNAEYRGVDRPTDVLSFPMLEGGGANHPGLLGDIVICVPKAAAQAKERSISVHEEVMRLLVHGLLHLLGYDHEKSSDQERKMKRRERELLGAIAKMA